MKLYRYARGANDVDAATHQKWPQRRVRNELKARLLGRIRPPMAMCRRRSASR
jgi:hypothetical protein